MNMRAQMFEFVEGLSSAYSKSQISTDILYFLKWKDEICGPIFEINAPYYP